MATPTDTGDSGGGGVLSPIDRLTELLYGIILVLTFTGTVRVAALARDTGERPLRVAFQLAGFGVVLVAATIALGG